MPQVGPICHPQRIFRKIGISCFLLVLASRWLAGFSPTPGCGKSGSKSSQFGFLGDFRD